MEININTNTSIETNERMNNYFKEEISNALSIFSDRITRLEVHLADENGPKSNVDDITCTLEARLSGLQPQVVTAKGASVEKSVSSAVSKMKSALQRIKGKSAKY